jgi:XamI restriction endonuclease
MPSAKTFYGECSFYGRRADLLIGLNDGRTVAVEAKDSSSVVNSVKRVLNDTAAKAKHWGAEVGKTVVPVALISGVFGTEDLKKAQTSGLYLVWAHDLDSFAEWLEAQ